MRRSLASSSGHLRHGGAWCAWAAVWARFPWLDALFAREGWAFHARWPVRSVKPGLRSSAQYFRLAGGAGGSVLVFCPVGRYVEFYGPQRLLAERALGLRPVYLPRAGYGFTVGFPRRLACAYVQRAVAARLAVVLVGTVAGARPNGPRRRWPVRLLVAAGAAGGARAEARMMASPD